MAVDLDHMGVLGSMCGRFPSGQVLPSLRELRRMGLQ